MIIFASGIHSAMFYVVPFELNAKYADCGSKITRIKIVEQKNPSAFSSQK